MQTPSSGTSAPATDYRVLTWLVAATFVVILNETIIVNAVPRLMVQFDVSARSAQWLATAFMLTMAVVIPVTGWFLQRVTTRHAFAIAMSTFCAGTLLAALAPAFWVLLTARVVQASGTAVMLPLLMTTLMTVVPEHDRGRVMGNVTLAMSVAPALGPAVSGVVLEYLSWRWMFGLVLPIAAGIAVVGLSRLTDVGAPSAGSVDVLSVVVSALGFGTLVYGLSQFGAPGRTGRAWLLVGTGLLLVAVFVLRQVLRRRAGREPLLDLSTLTHRTYALGLVLMSVAFMAMLGAMILLPLYLQDARQLSVLQTGLLLMPGGLAMGILGPRVGHAFDLHGGRVLVVPGSVGIVAGLVLLTRVGLDTPIWYVLLAHVVLMLSLALVFTPVFTLSLGSVPPQLYSHASSLLGALQQVAGGIGTAVVITVMSSRAAHLVEQGSTPAAGLVGGMQTAFTVATVLGVLVVVLAVLMPARVPGAGPHGAPVPDLADERPAPVTEPTG